MVGLPLLALFFATSFTDFLVGWTLSRTPSRAKRRALLATTLAVNFATLGFFKYFNFFAESLAELGDAVGWHFDAITLRLVLPIGISFYTFQSVAYVIDVYRGQIQAIKDPIHYLAFVSFFPQMVAGPIERASHLLPQFAQRRRFDYALAVDGCRYMLWGFFKKMVLADNLALYVDASYGDWAHVAGPRLALATVCFAFQIYCDFSGYSDIAIGAGRLLGISLVRNFAYPYFSQSISEFWRRWHISLSTWFRDYVYIPLGGSRVTRPRAACNVMLTFAASGLWHGASWNFVTWGAMNGAGTLPSILTGRNAKSLRGTDVPGGERLIPTAATATRMLLTFGLICVTWVFFRASTFGAAGGILRRIAVDAPYPSAYASLLQRGAMPRAHVLLALGVLVALEWVNRRHPHPLVVGHWPWTVRWGLYTVMTWGILMFGAEQVGQFIYFQF